MPSANVAELRERLETMPGVVAPSRPRTRPAEHAPAPARHRKGEEGPADLLATDDIVIHAERIPEVAAFLRDSLGYDMLSNLTAVDLLADQLIELVYHFIPTDGGLPAVLKVRIPRDNPEAPSLMAEWPGAILQEREAYDLYGVRFTGHQDLQRIYMWEEFEGFPMRKDFPRQGDKYFGGADEE